MTDKDRLILSLADHLYICSRLLTRAAERLGWDSDEVRQLVAELNELVKRDVDASVNAQE